MVCFSLGSGDRNGDGISDSIWSPFDNSGFFSCFSGVFVSLGTPGSFTTLSFHSLLSKAFLFLGGEPDSAVSLSSLCFLVLLSSCPEDDSLANSVEFLPVEVPCSPVVSAFEGGYSRRIFVSSGLQDDVLRCERCALK